MSRTALSKNTTYGTLVSNARNESRMTTTGYSLLTDSNLYLVISYIIQRFALILSANNKPFYRDRENLTLIGDASPYYIDCSALNPYWNDKVRLTHVTSANVRTPITCLDPNKTEEFARLATIEANSIIAVQLGWGFRIFFGSNITVTKATDVIEFAFDSQPITSGAGSGTYLDCPDSLVPYVKDELIDYMVNYKGVLPEELFQKSRIERIQNLSKV